MLLQRNGRLPNFEKERKSGVVSTVLACVTPPPFSSGFYRGPLKAVNFFCKSSKHVCLELLPRTRLVIVGNLLYWKKTFHIAI